MTDLFLFRPVLKEIAERHPDWDEAFTKEPDLFDILINYYKNVSIDSVKAIRYATEYITQIREKYDIREK